MCTFAAYYLQRGVINAAQCQDHRSAPLSYCTHLEEILFVMIKCISHDLPCPQGGAGKARLTVPHSECREQVPDSECQSQAGLERGRPGSEGLKAANHIQLTQDRSQIAHREFSSTAIHTSE